MFRNSSAYLPTLMLNVERTRINFNLAGISGTATLSFPGLFLFPIPKGKALGTRLTRTEST